MAQAPSIKIESRINWIGRLAIYLTKRGIRLPAPVVKWMCERAVQCRVDGGPWRKVTVNLTAEYLKSKQEQRP